MDAQYRFLFRRQQAFWDGGGKASPFGGGPQAGLTRLMLHPRIGSLYTEEMKPGDLFGRYRIIRPLAQGGMGEVYLARQEGPSGFARTVVIKRVLPHLASNEALVSMFLDEARIAANLSHPNVVQIVDFGELEGSYFLAMEYLAGEDLGAIRGAARKRGAFVPFPIACKIIADACDGLHHAHIACNEDGNPLHIVHRDISPSNIFVTYQGIVKVLDFGIAKAEGRALQTETGVLKGKYPYMSPEQISAAPLDCRSDIFSLGGVFFDLLTNRSPFKRDNALAMLKALLEDPIPSPKQVRQDMPDELEALVMKALARDKEDRFSSAQEMRAMIVEVMPLFSSPNVGDEVGPYVQELMGEERVQTRSRVTRMSKFDPNAPIGTGSGFTPSGFTPSGLDSDSGLSRGESTSSHTELECTTATKPPSLPDEDGDTVRDLVSQGHEVGEELDIDLELTGALATSSATQPEGAPKRKRSPATMLLAAASLVLIAGGLTFSALRFVDSSPETFQEEGTSDIQAAASRDETVTAPDGALRSVEPDVGGQEGIGLGVADKDEAALHSEGGGAEAREDDGEGPTRPLAPAGAGDQVRSATKAQTGASVPSRSRQPRDRPEDTRAGKLDSDSSRKSSLESDASSPGPSPEPAAVEDPSASKVSRAVEIQQAPPPTAERGKLNVNCIPWCRILVDGRDTGLTSPALGIELEAGRRRITVRNPPSGRELERVVEIVPGETVREAFRF